MLPQRCSGKANSTRYRMIRTSLLNNCKHWRDRPQGGQIYTDGFAGGVPPKSSIREIRINSNPFSAEYDQPGNGRVEILTKPGGETVHGQFSTQFNNQDFNTRSPLYVQSSSLPPYKNLLWNGNIGGPIKRNKASFTLDFNHYIGLQPPRHYRERIHPRDQSEQQP